MILLPTRRAEVRGQIVFFQELTAGWYKVNTSVKLQPRRCKERKFTSLNLEEHKTTWPVRLREPEKKSRSLSAHLFLTWIYCLFLSSWQSFHSSILSFFLSVTSCFLVVNKPKCMLSMVSHFSTLLPRRGHNDGLRSI